LVLIGLSLPVASYGADFRFVVDQEAPYPLWLPAPGSSVSGIELPASAEAARQKGLAAVRAQNWKTAVDAFKEALDDPACAPSLVFNLALALERDGRKTSAALWYRVYLAQRPDASNADAVLDEIARLSEQSETLALRGFGEAERLAIKLSAVPLGPQMKSQQQQALEGVAFHAYLAGLSDKGDSIIAKIRKLPGVQPLGSALEEQRRGHGLSAAYFTWDISRAKTIEKQWGSGMDSNDLGLWMAGISGRRGDITEARRWVESVTGDFWASSVWRSIITMSLEHAGAYEAAAMIYTRTMSVSNKLDEYLFTHAVWCIRDSFWGGRPDVALDLAQAARKYAERFPAKDRPVKVRENMVMAYAMLGDRTAIEQALREGQPLSIGTDFPTIAIMLATTLPAVNAISAIDRLAAYWNAQKNQSPDRLPYIFPLVYFARELLSGQPAAAFNILDNTEGWHTQALKFAVATGREDLALKIVDRAGSKIDLIFLNRILLRPSSSAAMHTLRQAYQSYANSICQGWRPRDAAQAQNVAWRLGPARLELVDPKADDLITDGVDWTAKNNPERLPSRLAQEASDLYRRVRASRVEE
jgi:tetratricopeptide (TPR) repeat protein